MSLLWEQHKSNIKSRFFTHLVQLRIGIHCEIQFYVWFDIVCSAISKQEERWKYMIENILAVKTWIYKVTPWLWLPSRPMKLVCWLIRRNWIKNWNWNWKFSFYGLIIHSTTGLILTKPQVKMRLTNEIDRNYRNSLILGNEHISWYCYWVFFVIHHRKHVPHKEP